MLKTYIKWYVLSGISICMVFIAGCGITGESDLKKFSPKQSYEYYDKARHDGDVEALRKIMYFSSSMSEKDKKDKAKKTVASSTEKMYKIKHKVAYEKILSEDTAQVGVVFRNKIPFRPQIPFNEAILKKQDGIWKFFAYKTAVVTEKQLLEDIKKDPNDASAYYYLGEEYRAKERYVKLKECFEKYYELEPKGFWVNSILYDINQDYKELEKKLLETLSNLPKTAYRAATYRKLGYLYMDTGEYEKALKFLKKSLDLDPKQIGKADDVREAIKEIQEIAEK